MDIAKASRKIESPAAAAGRVVLIYVAFAALWIFASDTALQALVGDPTAWARVGMFKGLLFVAVTALLLYGLLIHLLKTTGEARQALAAHYATLIEQARDIVLLIDPDGRIVEANRAAEAAYGYRHAELLGITVDDLRVPDSQPDMQRQWAAAASTEGVLFETRHRHRDGRVFPVEVSSRAIEIEGKLYRQSFIRDITERKQAQFASEAMRNQLQATLDALPDLLFEVDAEGRIFSYHSYRSDLLAAPPDAFVGKLVADVLSPDTARAVQHAIAEAAQNGFSYGETYRLALPQGERWFELSVAPLHQGAKFDQRFITISRDITERKQAEWDLARRNADLERFNRVSVNRELDMIALKKRVNALSVELGRAPPFDLAAVNAAEAGAKR